MKILWDRGEATVLDIQQSMDDDLIDSTIRTLLTILEQKGYVERSLCPTNRRKVDILITKKGLNSLEEMDPLVRASSDAMQTLTKTESRELNRLLDKMRS